MPRSTRVAGMLALITLAALVAVAPADAASRRHRAVPAAKRSTHRVARSTAPAKPRYPTWVAPFKTITSGDGRFTACNYVMRQEGWGAVMLFEAGHLIRVWQGLRAVAWEPGTTRLLVTEAVPDDDLKWFMIDPSQGGADGDMRELHRTPVPAGRMATFRGWARDGRMLFGEGIDATRVDTLDTPPVTGR